MARIKYSKSISGTNKLMTSPQMLAFLLTRAQAGLAYAQAVAPRESGDYAEAFEIGRARRRGGPRKNRAEVELVNTSDHASAVEWTNSGGHRVLGRTVDVIERGL